MQRLLEIQSFEGHSPTEAMGATCKDTHLNVANSWTIKQLPHLRRVRRSKKSSGIYLLCKLPVL